MSRGARVDAAIERGDDRVVVRWTAGSASGGARFDHLPGTTPEWLGSAEELLQGADRRLEGRVLGAVADLAEREGLQLGLWRDGEGIELLA